MNFDSFFFRSQNDSASSAPSQPMPPQHPSQHGYYNNPSYYGMNAKTYEEYLSYQQQYYYQYYQNAYNAAAGQGQAQGQVSMPAAPPSRPPPQNLVSLLVVNMSQQTRF